VNLHYSNGTRKRHDISAMLRHAGLRPTRQRVALGKLLFNGKDRHVTAEMLHEEAIREAIPVSLATVYNTLHQFTGAGLLREIAADGSKTHFDTNTSDHHHFLVEGENVVMDVPVEDLRLGEFPEPPEGMEIVRVDVVVRVRRKSNWAG
jgi:Fur family iron response transcriptional regulator